MEGTVGIEVGFCAQVPPEATVITPLELPSPSESASWITTPVPAGIVT